MEWKPTAKAMGNLAVAKKLRNMADYDVDDALELFGLRRRPSRAARFLSGFGLVLGGALVGAAIGMFLAPRPARYAGRPMGQGGMRPGVGGSQVSQPHS